MRAQKNAIQGKRKLGGESVGLCQIQTGTADKQVPLINKRRHELMVDSKESAGNKTVMFCNRPLMYSILLSYGEIDDH